MTLETEDSSPDTAPLSPYAALRIPDYRFFLGMRMMTTFGLQIMAVSVGYFVYDLTGNPLMLGLIGLTEALPAIGVSLYAGHLADKNNRRSMLIGCLVLFFTVSVLLMLLAYNRTELPRPLLLGGIYSAIFITGLARGFFSPVNFSFLPQLVPRSVLPNAITWNSSSWEVATISGMGIGGLLYGFFGVSTAFAVMTLLLVSALVFVLQIEPKPVPTSDNKETALERIRIGLQFVFSRRLIWGAILVDLFAVLFGGAVALLPVFAKDILHVGPEGLGILRAGMPVGAITMAFVIAHRPIGKHAGVLMLACIAGFGLCMIGFAFSRLFWLSFAILILAGVFDEVSVFIRASLLQYLTPDHIKGRVASVNSMFITSSNEIGAFESGLAASLMGTIPSVIFGGCMTLVVVALTWWRLPELRKLDYREIL